MGSVNFVLVKNCATWNALPIFILGKIKHHSITTVCQHYACKAFSDLELSQKFLKQIGQNGPVWIKSVPTFRPTLDCSVWLSTPTSVCQSTPGKLWANTEARGRTRCLLTCSPLLTMPTATCCRTERTSLCSSRELSLHTFIWRQFNRVCDWSMEAKTVL